ncbi:MAG: hypothetical protein GY749_02030, partial [Desulfobacteraceae bacterium]|nr:hypothetical protein [Desulfobacteraceae bacterium]
NALAFAHQMAIRWFLSEEVNRQNGFEIILYAGQFAEADVILPLLSIEADFEGCNIYLTDFAYQCSKITDMKIMLGKTPEQIAIGVHNRVNLWMLEYFWSHRYFYLIRDLLEEDNLPTTKQSQTKFYQELCFPDQVNRKTFRALTLIRQFPQNSLLILEIARVLLARRMFREADMILANILSLNPHNVLARIFRITVYANLALEQSLLSASEMSFERAVAEGKFITGFCSDEPELWRVFGLAYFARALKYFNVLRKHEAENRDNIEEKMFASFKQAEDTFLKGLTSSTVGQDSNSLFLLITTRCMYELLKADKTLLDRDKTPVLKDTGNIYRKTAVSFFIMVGWLSDPSAKGKSESELLDSIPDSQILQFIRHAADTVSKVQYRALSKQYIPGMKYASSSFIWDLMPRLTIGICRQIRHWLEEMHDETQFLSDYNLSVDVIAPVFPHDPEEFLKAVKKSLDTVNSLIPDEEWQKHDDEFLDEDIMKRVSEVKLMLLHFE